MLIPIADMPRWYAERKPKDAIAISHGADTLTWEQIERNANARAFAAKGVKPGDFAAIGLPNSNVFFETTFAVWKCGATAGPHVAGCRECAKDSMPAGKAVASAMRNPDIIGAYLVTGDFQDGRLRHRL